MKHPLEKLPCCPRCGSKHFGIHDKKSRRCDDCGLTYYANPAAAVAVLIVNEKGELLVTKRAFEPAKGMLDLPGGFCDPNETVEEAVSREVMEETGLEVTDISYLGSRPNVYEWQGIEIPTLDFFFSCKVSSTDAHAADDAAECMWIKQEDLNPALFGMHSIRRFLEKFPFSLKTFTHLTSPL